MQAHPQSSSAARINSTSRTAPLSTPPRNQPRTRVLITNSTSSVADTSGLAHDAGNLLAALGLYCDLLSSPGVLRPEHRHYATELCLISNRSSELIRRLLGTASPPEAPEALEPEPPTRTLTSPHRSAVHASNEATACPNHATVLRGLAPVLKHLAAGVAHVTVTCPASLPPLDFPAEILERITVNLVCNAADAIRQQRSTTRAAALPARGEIRIALAVVSDRVHLTVEDNGPGMPPPVAAKFLNPSPLPQGARHGMGHRIIHELASVSGGQLSVRVRPGNGTVFCLKWPLPTSTTKPAAPWPPQPNL